LCVFYGQKDAMKSIFIKKCFLFTVGSVCRKVVHNWVANVSMMTKLKRRRRNGLDSSQKLVCGFRRTGKAMGQVYQCWWRICREINVFFQVQISHGLLFISICDLFTDSSSYFCNMMLRRSGLAWPEARGECLCQGLPEKGIACTLWKRNVRPCWITFGYIFWRNVWPCGSSKLPNK
jgi:hypothetical protein